MTDSPTNQCARCGESIRGKSWDWTLRSEWRMFLEEEHDLRWFPNGPTVICCSDCFGTLDTLHTAISEERAYGDDDTAEELESQMRDELASLDFECIVDEFEA